MKIVSIVSQMQYCPDLLVKLQAFGELVQANEHKADEDRIISLLKDADGAIIGASGVSRIGPDVFAACRKLKVISLLGAGYDFIDIQAATAAGVKVLNARGANSQSVAEHTWGMILGLSKRITESHIATAAGNKSFEPFLGIEMMGKTIGIIGPGEIGRRVAKIAAGFDMNILAHSRSETPVDDLTMVSKQELLKQSDVVVVTVPLNDSTRNMISGEDLALMKPTAILINPAREGLIDKEAVLAALARKRLFGFGMELDINSAADQRFYDFPNVILTPHTAFFTGESEERVDSLAVENILSFFMGSIQNPVN
ncbi:MAG: (S)-sulfolactate dehydrogenase [candidate division WS6 bacterium OLB20]|uniref:(S)-sulfolactate dehydrogenase n=1 Tax=candidate division WS6 bacterium OLB20 TaxID=1617426 RepID=A0A136LX65_9BACT|nr:MAG: (S)-sulfolactate dehydrogenase [candidate division WS6 bacterium OLB20]